MLQKILFFQGSINDDICDRMQNLMLIPESEKREKKTESINISESYKKSTGHLSDLKKQEKFPPTHLLQKASGG
ncbi:Uncharacterized protein dnm_078430 [Desulfonema magnum]|uniref:Uncharacterized protein n=1 Tax=Desulfonema magnum TaxID=45655 RepID=A0A975GS86_9BACT|nr:Uncharacterized protein dnm_078430 [Desulfonema magnum]